MKLSFFTSGQHSSYHCYYWYKLFRIATPEEHTHILYTTTRQKLLNRVHVSQVDVTAAVQSTIKNFESRDDFPYSYFWTCLMQLKKNRDLMYSCSQRAQMWSSTFARARRQVAWCRLICVQNVFFFFSPSCILSNDSSSLTCRNSCRWLRSWARWNYILFFTHHKYTVIELEVVRFRFG